MPNVTAYVGDSATSTLTVDWYADGATVEGALAYDFDHVVITATGVASGTEYYSHIDVQQQAQVSDVVAPETGILPRVLVTVDAVYTSPGSPNVTRRIFSYEVRLAGPYAPTIQSPADVSTGDTAAGVEVAALFASPVPGDRVTGWGARWTVDAGASWTETPFTATPDDAVQQSLAVFAGGTFADSTDVQYQVCWYGVDRAKSPWSATRWASFFDPPAAPTITSPASGFVDYRTAVALADAAGREQWQIRRCADDGGLPGGVLFDTGARQQVGPVAEPIVFATPGVVEWVQARQAMHELWSPWADVQVQPQYSRPPKPIVGLEPNPDAGGIDVFILLPTPTGSEVAADHCVVRARECGTDTVEWQALAPLSGRVLFGSPRSCVNYEFQVDAVALTGPARSTEWVR